MLKESEFRCNIAEVRVVFLASIITFRLTFVTLNILFNNQLCIMYVTH